MTHLRIEHVAKQYGGRTVLHDISLALPRGEFLSLLGPSGCGKTTLLRIVAGFELPDAGRLLLEERDITALAPRQRQMGMVFQAYSLFPNMTALDNVRFGLRVRQLDPAEQQRRAREMLDLVGLGDHMGKFPHQLSGGQQQRVALARALAIRPALLLLDEPLSALDAKVRVQLRDEIRRIQQDTGVTTIFVTHDQEEALSVSDRVVVMNQGRLAQVGDPSAIYAEPENIFVARFVGQAAEFSGRVLDGAAGIVEVMGRPVRAARARGLPEGASVHFLLRPESVRVAAAGEDASGLPGTVRARTFTGAHTRLEVGVGPDAVVLALVPAVEAEELPPGAAVHVSWAEDAARVLPAEPGLIGAARETQTVEPVA
ncbi:MAG TPA: ABC transporter ATP-binding protein [Acetobacteraceae bacterium]|nr:ABC transporter ATP-binding protein [Acetobacteraceae bacterium]